MTAFRKHMMAFASLLLSFSLVVACSGRAVPRSDDGSDVEAFIGARAPQPGQSNQTTLSNIFGEDVRGVCFVEDFPLNNQFVRERFIQNTSSQIDARTVLTQLDQSDPDSDHVLVYLINADQRVVRRFRPHQLAPRFQVSTNRRTGLTGCWSSDHVARVSRQTGGRILLFLEMAGSD